MPGYPTQRTCRALLATAALGCGSLALTTRDAAAFTHIVQPGDTLASIAEGTYGRIQHEKVLVAANALNVEGGTAIVPGMRLQVPAMEHHRVVAGETWASLAEALLGHKRRADVLAAANGTSPWLPPEDGAEIVVPYNLRVIATSSDTIVTIAYKYLGDKNKAWVLDHYNGFRGRRVQRGDVVLVPLTDLPLTPEGRAAAATSSQLGRTESEGGQRKAQAKVNTEMPALIADVRAGRYVNAVARANQFLASGELTKPQIAGIHGQLLEAYVALGSIGLASASCAALKAADPDAVFDPIDTSPKIIAACAANAP